MTNVSNVVDITAPQLGQPAQAPAPTAEPTVIVPPAAGPAATQPEVEPEATPEVDKVLVQILGWKRPHDTPGELAFVNWLEKELQRRVKQVPGAHVQRTILQQLCVIVPIKGVKGKPIGQQKTSATMFSCHMDTVHSKDGDAQALLYDPTMSRITIDQKHPNAGSCLGADDGAGIWLMLQMISAKVPGTYMFHRGEERGGIGSTAMLKEQKAFLERHDLAIAFDRKGQGDIITHQGGQRCASDKCAAAIIKEFKEHGLSYFPSRNGSFTDTKVYRRVINECLNISCGYENAHGPDEELDWDFLWRLSKAVIATKWDSIPVDRNPAVEETPAYTQYPQGHQRAGASWYDKQPKARVSNDGYAFGVRGGNGSFGGFGFDEPGYTDDEKKADRHAAVNLKGSLEPSLLQELETLDVDELRDIAADPDTAFNLLIAMYTELQAMNTKVQTLRGLIDY